MKTIIKMCSLFLILLLFGVSVISCAMPLGTPAKEKAPPPEVIKKSPPLPWEPAKGQKAKFTYRYFPASSVYFNIERGIFFYRSSDKWIDSYSLPSTVPINQDQYVILRMMTGKPYTFHKDVVKRYPPDWQRK